MTSSDSGTHTERWWSRPLPLTTWVSIAAWLAIVGFVIVAAWSPWGALLSAAAVLLVIGAAHA